jgi:chondroitin 4-sulfotransferase 11
VISHKYKCIFVQQTKVAGTSILKSFGIDWSHPDALYVCGGALCPEYYDEFKDYFRFSVVRNPWDRFVSAWLYIEETRPLPMRQVLENMPQFKTWDTASLLNRPYYHVTRKQSDLLYGPDGKLHVDFLARYETLQQDMDTICDIIGKPRTNLPLENTCPVERKPYREYFTEQYDRDLFMTHFKEDVEHFNYEF